MSAAIAVEDAVVALVVAVDDPEGLRVVDVAAVGLDISKSAPFCHDIKTFSQALGVVIVDI